MHQRAARCFGALRKITQALRQYYVDELPRIQRPGPQLTAQDPRYPYPTSYTSLKDSVSHDFLYSQAMPSTLVFFGIEETTPIVIKFVRRYSSDAHIFCADRGFAPELRGFNELPGGWYMVVMEDISRCYRQAESSADLVKNRDEMTEKIVMFHQNHYVHGDIRNTNVMVRKDGEAGFMLVDFDWAGINGRVRYPSNINITGVTRPKDVYDGELITAEHDMEMVRYMLDSYSTI